MNTTPARRDDSLLAPGVGPIPRCVAVLRLLSTAGGRGMPLTSISQRTGLAPSTVHRLLAQMGIERLVQQLEETRCYALGPLAFEIGLAAAQQFDQRSRYRPVLERLASEAGDTAYCILRSGSEAVCADMVEGPSPIRVVTLRIGSRRPLGLGAGGLAILAWLPDEEREAMLQAVLPEIERDWDFSAAALRRSIDEARRVGFAAIRNRVSSGVSALGMPFSDATGCAIGALSIAAVNTRMTASRVALLSAPLRRAVRDVERAWRESV
jgi:DNA-binding IclR family transcriptional regulator